MPSKNSQKNNNDLSRKWIQICAKCLLDPQFKQRVLQSPEKVLQEYGIKLPTGAKVTIHEETDKILHLDFPAKNSNELTEGEIKKVAGGGYSDVLVSGTKVAGSGLKDAASTVGDAVVDTFSTVGKGFEAVGDLLSGF